MSILKLDNIKYSQNNDDILKGINLNIDEGDIISIVGPSGSGKSTLLKICSDLISATAGDIHYRDKNYKDYNPIELRKNISYCVQIPFLFGDTVYDNLSYPFKIRKKEVDKTLVIEFLEKFNLDKSYIEKSVDSLSGGEKQRIALIRNLIFKPDILLLDEVTASLDPENSKVVENIIKDLNKSGTTVLWITHDIAQSNSIFNKKITMENGLIKHKEDLR